MRDELTHLNFALTSSRLDASLGSDTAKPTYFELYKSLQEKYVYVKTKRAKEWTTQNILLHIEREKV